MNKGDVMLLVEKLVVPRSLFSLFLICCLLEICLSGAGAASCPLQGVDKKDKVLSPVYYTFTAVDGHSEIVIQSDAVLDQYQSFFLEDPPRLVIDVKGKKLPLPVMSKVIDRPELHRIRAAQRGDAVRFVFDLPLKKKVDFQVAREEQWLKVTISLADEPPVAAAPPPAAKKSPAKEVKSAVVPAAEPAAKGNESKTKPAAEPAAKKPSLVKKVKKYSGRKVSLDLFQEDLEKFFAEITRQTGIFFSLGPEVKGKVSLRVTDVPWDQAVDMVLDYYHLQMVSATDRPSHFVVSKKK